MLARLHGLDDEDVVVRQIEEGSRGAGAGQWSQRLGAHGYEEVLEMWSLCMAESHFEIKIFDRRLTDSTHVRSGPRDFTNLGLDVEGGAEEAECERGVAVELEAVQMVRLCDGRTLPAVHALSLKLSANIACRTSLGYLTLSTS